MNAATVTLAALLIVLTVAAGSAQYRLRVRYHVLRKTGDRMELVGSSWRYRKMWDLFDVLCVEAGQRPRCGAPRVFYEFCHTLPGETLQEVLWKEGRLPYGQCYQLDMSLNRKAAARLCRMALSRAELCNVTAKWLAGELAVGPTYDGRPDPETAAIAPTLIRLNRAGILTVNSQPGLDAVHGQQRAEVLLYCPVEHADRLSDAMASAGLEVRRPGDVHAATIRPVPQTPRWLARFARTPRLKPIPLGNASREASADVDAGTVFMQVFDPKWGRSVSPLWETADRFARDLPRLLPQGGAGSR